MLLKSGANIMAKIVKLTNWRKYLLQFNSWSSIVNHLLNLNT